MDARKAQEEELVKSTLDLWLKNVHTCNVELRAKSNRT